jgi:dTDP-4-amino-4,6-dideoxygalactose transaminase
MMLIDTYISVKAINSALEGLRSTFISEGRLVRRFEEEPARTQGVVRPDGFNTSASVLDFGLVIAGVEHGKEMLPTAQTPIRLRSATLTGPANSAGSSIEPWFE